MPISVVQAVEATQGFGTSLSIAISAVTSGNALVIAFKLPTANALGTVTDSASGTYTLVTSGLANPTDNDSTLRIYRRVNITNAPTTANISWTGATTCVGWAYQLSGVDNTTPVGQTGRAQHVSGSTTQEVVLTTATDNECAIGIVDFSGNSTFTPHSGYSTSTGQPSYVSGVYRADVGTAGAKSVGGTTSGSPRWAVVAATFRVAAAGGVPVAVLVLNANQGVSHAD